MPKMMGCLKGCHIDAFPLESPQELKQSVGTAMGLRSVYCNQQECGPQEIQLKLGCLKGTFLHNSLQLPREILSTARQLLKENKSEARDLPNEDECLF